MMSLFSEGVELLRRERGVVEEEGEGFGRIGEGCVEAFEGEVDGGSVEEEEVKVGMGGMLFDSEGVGLLG